jgi:tubulin monoglycylase TTLL3/8
MEVYINKIDESLRSVEHHWAQYHIDGTRNIWILKPGAKSRGRGFFFERFLNIKKLFLFRNCCL